MRKLDNATAHGWRAAAGPAARAEGRALRLFRDGVLSATLRIDDDGVWITPAAAAQRVAVATPPPPAPAPALNTLTQGLDAAAP